MWYPEGNDGMFLLLALVVQNDVVVVGFNVFLAVFGANVDIDWVAQHSISLGVSVQDQFFFF